MVQLETRRGAAAVRGRRPLLPKTCMEAAAMRLEDHRNDLHKQVNGSTGEEHA